MFFLGGWRNFPREGRREFSRALIAFDCRRKCKQLLIHLAVEQSRMLETGLTSADLRLRDFVSQFACCTCTFCTVWPHLTYWQQYYVQRHHRDLFIIYLNFVSSFSHNQLFLLFSEKYRLSTIFPLQPLLMFQDF